eukprot:SAG31_NODE_7305_length_1724_cov_1.775385_2_plen_268_part_00
MHKCTGGKYSGRWPTGADYGRTAVQWARAIKRVFPHVRALAIACHSYAYAKSTPTYRGETRRPCFFLLSAVVAVMSGIFISCCPPKMHATRALCFVRDNALRTTGRVWNAHLYPIVSAAGSGVDGVVIHPYLHLDDDSKGGGMLQPGMPPRSKGDGPTGWSMNQSLQLAMEATMRSTKGMEALMGVPFALRSCAAGDAATQTPLPPNLRMVVTEYNVMERAGPFKLSWAHAMFVGSAVLNLLSVRQMDTAMLHVLLNGYGWGALCVF